MQATASAASASAGAELELQLRVGGADHRGAGDARLALKSLELVAEDVEVNGRVDDDPLRPVVDERAVPARPHELGRLRRTQLPNVGDGVGRKRGVVGAGDGEPVVVVRALGAIRRGPRAEGACRARAPPRAGRRGSA